MKRMLPILLSLLLLLSGCQQHTNDEHLELTGDSQKDPYQWSFFCYAALWDTAEYYTIQLPDDTSLCWTGSEYQITDSTGTRSYPYLASFVDIQETDGGWNYINEYVLTDVESLTLAEFRANGTGELVYRDSFYCASAATFGDAPKAVTDLIDRRMGDILLSEYMQTSVFERSFTGSMGDRQETIRRWDYSGNLLCEVHVDGYAECFAELGDGGFLTTLHHHGNDTYQVLCVNSDGSTRWAVSLGAAKVPQLCRMIVTPEGIFGFGYIRQEGRFQDVYICHISPEGELLKETILGGTDYDDVDWVEDSADGFTVYGTTQSRDGDFPLSEDGYGVDFVMAITNQLEVRWTKIENHDLAYFDVEGYCNGSPVFEGDRILKVSSKDNLPVENIHSLAIFELEGGYVVLRRLAFGIYPYVDPAMSYQPSYCQLIATGYDAEGNPLWQTVSQPYIS